MDTILVAIDFSKSSELLVDHAINLAKGLVSSIYLLHVVSPNEDISGREIKDEASEISKIYAKEIELLNGLAQTVRGHDIDTHAIFAEGGVVEAIREEATSVKADLIIAGTPGHNELEDLFLVSVSHGLVKHAPCPVLLVPTK